MVGWGCEGDCGEGVDQCACCAEEGDDGGECEEGGGKCEKGGYGGGDEAWWV